MQVSTSTEGLWGIYLEWDQTQSFPPFTQSSWKVQFSLDGLSFEDINSSYYQVDSLGWTSLSATTASHHYLNLASLAVLNNQPNVTFRFLYDPYPWLVFSPSTLVRFDNIAIGSGLTSNTDNFENVVNLPQDAAFGEYPYFIPDNTQLNVFGGGYDPMTFEPNYGRIGQSTTAGDGFNPANIEINVFGAGENDFYNGTVDWGLQLNNGSVLNLRGGVTNGYLNVNAGATLNIESGHAQNDTFLNAGGTASLSGGIMGGNYYNYLSQNRMMASGLGMGLYADNLSHITVEGGLLWGTPYFAAGSQLELQGDEYLLNGQPLVGLDAIGSSVLLNLEPSDVLSGTLADGTPFSLHGHSTQAEITVVKSSLPSIGPAEIVIDNHGDPLPSVLRQGQTLELNASNYLQQGAGRFLAIAPGATANFHGGHLDLIVMAFGSQVTVDGTANLTTLAVEAGSEVVINGGTIQKLFIRDGAQVDVQSGGVFGYDASSPGGSLTMHGGNFRINGSPLALNQLGDILAVDLDPGDILTGELTDGRPFMLYGGQMLADGVLSVKLDSPPPLEATIIDITSPSSLLFARDGQTVNLRAGGTLPHDFEAGYGSRVTILDNSSSFSIQALPGSEVVLKGGTSGNQIRGLSGSLIRIEEGSLSSLIVEREASGRIEGGTLGQAFMMGGDLQITGGFVDRLDAFFSSFTSVEGGNIGNAYVQIAELRIEGGQIENLSIDYQGIATFVGTQFIVDGVDVTSLLSTSTPYVVTTRDMQFEGTLADGSTFSEFLSGNDWNNEWWNNLWYANPYYATVQLLLAPPETLAGDYNGDGLVNLADYTVWRDTLGASVTEGTGADGNGDGVVNAEDYQLWKSHFGNSSGEVAAIGAQVPEPGTLWPLALGLGCFLLGRAGTKLAA